ncbi:M28 family peptidase [Roseivirga sp.]|uniref:M28 family peptidase n=1 Tax=Roseivirga sp. TaxID=1964215 RepID=UPI003B8DF065
MKHIKTILILFAFVFLYACGGKEVGSSASNSAQEPLKTAPSISPDSAFAFVQKQVDFGPRVPNSKAHKEASQWLKSKFESFGAAVTMQEFTDYVYDGTKVELTNIIASFYPEKKKRIMLSAHWDTRPFSDQGSSEKYAVIDGANDGGSGVGVLMEVARALSINEAPDVGIDIILFDGEDWGEHNDEASRDLPNDKRTWWCLGSQYWSKNKHKANYSAYYGILLDMVGAPNATFYYDSVSQENAGRVLQNVWSIAEKLGYGAMFKKELGFGRITDDHVYINEDARIPMIDIIDYRPDTEVGFTPVWHTENDNMENISKETLGNVASLLMSVLYNE